MKLNLILAQSSEHHKHMFSVAFWKKVGTGNQPLGSFFQKPLLVLYLLRMSRRARKAKVQATVRGNLLFELCENGRKICPRDKNEWNSFYAVQVSSQKLP